MSKWAAIENIAVLTCATFLAYKWDTAWAFLLLILINYPVKRTDGNKN